MQPNKARQIRIKTHTIQLLYFLPLMLKSTWLSSNYPNQKWDVWCHYPSSAWYIIQSIGHRYIHTNRRQIFTRVLIMIDEITLPTCVVYSWTLMSLNKLLLISNKHHFHNNHALIISNYHSHSPNVDVLQSRNMCHHTNDCLSSHWFSILKIRTLNAHYSIKEGDYHQLLMKPWDAYIKCTPIS